MTEEVKIKRVAVGKDNKIEEIKKSKTITIPEYCDDNIQHFVAEDMVVMAKRLEKGQELRIQRGVDE